MLLALTALCASHLAAGENLAKPKSLGDAEERRWIEAVENHSTADGATVLQVLRFAEKLRPTKFKVGEITIGYNEASGEPDGVAIGYWIGARRLDGDSFVDLFYKVGRNAVVLAVTPALNQLTKDTTVNALEQGRTAFVLYVDEMYKDQCLDFDTKARLC